MIAVGLGVAAAAGTVTGTVRDAGGEGVGDVPITVVGASGRAAAQGVTAADGGFAVQVPSGSYRVRADPPPTSDWMSAWAPGVVDACDGARVEVGDGAAEVDLRLEVGSVVAGTLVDPSGAPVADALVTAVTDATYPRSGTTGADGRFRVGGVVPGDVVVALVTEAFPVQYAGGAFSATRAVPWTIEPGVTLDLGPVTLLPGITLTGTVYAADEPATGGAVVAFSGSALREAEVGPDGRWAVSGLPPGDATAWAISPGYATTYLPDADRPALYLPADDGEVLHDVDLWLPRESTVAGRLVGPGVDDWSGAVVSLVNDDHSVGVVAVPQADGAFWFGGLHGGRFSLWLSGAPDGIADGLWRDRDGAARVVDAPSQGALDLGDIDGAVGAQIHGVVTDDAGVPVGAALVVAQSEASGESKFVFSAEDGAYALEGLVPTAYQLTVRVERPCTADDGYVQIYYPDGPNPAFQEPLRLVGGESARWDPRLPADDDHDGMGDRWERINGLDPRSDDASLDPDRDGYSNLDEYLLGTDPHDRDGSGCGCGARAALGAGRLGGRGAGWAGAPLVAGLLILVGGRRRRG